MCANVCVVGVYVLSYLLFVSSFCAISLYFVCFISFWVSVGRLSIDVKERSFFCFFFLERAYPTYLWCVGCMNFLRHLLMLTLRTPRKAFCPGVTCKNKKNVLPGTESTLLMSRMLLLGYL